MADEEFTGRVIARVVNRGSKSEHRAAFLETAGGTFHLKRQSGPPFYDRTLVGLAGSEIRCRGRLRGTTLVLSRWRKVEPRVEGRKRS